MNGRHHRLSLSVSQFDGGRVILWIRVFGVEHDATGCDEQFYPVLLSTCPIVCQMGRSESSKPVWMAVYVRLSEWYDIRNCIVDVVCPRMSVSLMVVTGLCSMCSLYFHDTVFVISGLNIHSCVEVVTGVPRMLRM